MKYIKKQDIIKVTENKTEFQIPKSIWYLHELFKKSNKKLYLVGGAVRDFLTEEIPKDFDLATDANPNEIIDILINTIGLKERINEKELLLKNGYRINLQGEKFGVVVIYNMDGLEEGVEIATFREDITKGRNPDVKLGATIEGDTKRRDLTINAMFYDLDTKLIVDLVGGEDDLKNKVIRMVGDPKDRIDEDRLRILRIFRFSSRYNSKLDTETENAVKDNNKLIDVSQERIWDEFNKSFKQSKYFKTYLDLIDKFNMWSEIFPDVKITTSDYIETDNLSICLAQLFKSNDYKTISDKMIKDFNIPNKLSNKVKFLISLKELDIDMVNVFLKSKNRYSISDSEIEEWFNINNMNSKIHRAFINFNPIINTKDVITDLGIEVNNSGNPKNASDGQKLGIELNRRIIELFKERI